MMMMLGLYWAATTIAAQRPVAVISVSHHFPGVVCTGACKFLDSELVVQSDGSVTLRLSKLRHESRTFEYRVSPLQWEEFREAYAPLRPIGTKGPLGTCDEHTGIIEMTISWVDSYGQSRLLICRGAKEFWPVMKAFSEGYRTLRISPVTGATLSAEEAEQLR